MSRRLNRRCCCFIVLKSSRISRNFLAEGDVNNNTKHKAKQVVKCSRNASVVKKMSEATDEEANESLHISFLKPHFN